MAQRKPPARPAKKAAPTQKSATRPPVSRTSGPAARPPVRKPGKSIVNQKQTPWGVIITVAVIVVFAGGIIWYAVASHKSSTNPADARYTLPEVAAAKKIPGLNYKQEIHHTHVTHKVKYDTTPPTGGDHSAYWADSTGTVYPHAIANENAVHALEHGAVWITYRPGLAKSEVAKLSALVKGHNYTLMSPYPNLKTPISLQSWGYQLFVQKASDPRIQEFIAALRDNPDSTPEYPGATSQPTFVKHPSTFGHPLFQPASGGTAKTMGP